MAPGLIREQCDVKGVSIRAIADCRAAASVVTQEFANSIYKTGRAVWREGASDLLSLHGFGGMKVQLYETYFAAKVKAFDTVFDQVFFVVNKAVHSVLLGLPAIMAVCVHLLTITGRDTIPDMNKALTLNFMPTWHQQKAAESLNCLVVLMKKQPDQMDQALAWEKLDLGEFGPQLNLLIELIQENPHMSKSLKRSWTQMTKMNCLAWSPFQKMSHKLRHRQVQRPFWASSLRGATTRILCRCPGLGCVIC